MDTDKHRYLANHHEEYEGNEGKIVCSRKGAKAQKGKNICPSGKKQKGRAASSAFFCSVEPFSWSRSNL